MNKHFAMLLVIFLGAGSNYASADDCCCESCGCQAPCRKVCRLVCETKKVPKICYSCECEDFCVPGHSKRCGCRCECKKECGCECEHCHQVPNWVPTRAKVFTRHKLVKHETMEEVPHYKWVVENVCDGCACKCQTADESAPQSNFAEVQTEEDSQNAQEPAAQVAGRRKGFSLVGSLVGQRNDE